MDGPNQPPSKVRKRLCDDGTSLSDDNDSTMSEDGVQDPEEFTEVLSRRAKRLSNKTASRSSSSTITYPMSSYPLTVVFAPTVPTSSMEKLSKQKLSSYVSSVAPTEIMDVRINTRKNLIAVDVVTSSALDKLLRVTSVCDISVRAYVPDGRNTTAGVIQDVDPDITEDEFSALVF